jgi:UDP-2-acetamido-2-deoxy-ribo-hexuluronate aminotransferase
VCREPCALEAGLKAQGIPTAVHYPLALHQQPAYAAFYPGAAFPHSERLCARSAEPADAPHLSEAVQDRIVEAVSGLL